MDDATNEHCGQRADENLGENTRQGGVHPSPSALHLGQVPDEPRRARTQSPELDNLPGVDTTRAAGKISCRDLAGNLEEEAGDGRKPAPGLERPSRVARKKSLDIDVAQEKEAQDCDGIVEAKMFEDGCRTGTGLGRLEAEIGGKPNGILVSFVAHCWRIQIITACAKPCIRSSNLNDLPAKFLGEFYISWTTPMPTYLSRSPKSRVSTYI